MSQATLHRPIYLTREGRVFRLSFAFDSAIVERVKSLPYSRWDPESKTWTVDVTEQAVQALRAWFASEGLTDVYVDTLLQPGEQPPKAPAATLRPGSLRRPYLVHVGVRSDALYARLRSLPGAQWERNAQAMSYPPGASAALGELVARGVVADPDRVLTPADVSVSFDMRNGTFAVLGDPRAQAAFTRHFPGKDVIALWSERGIDVAFTDAFSEEVYRGELARGSGLQPAGMLEPLFAYQAESVAIAVERSGFAIWDQPGLGKTAQAIAWAHEIIVNRQQASRCVVVTPGAVKTQFAREILRFTGEQAVVVDGDRKRRERSYEQAKDARWVVLNYDLLHLDYKLISPIVSGQLLVADEAHKIKGRASKRGQAMRQLAGRAARRLALSGTPVENDPGEWYTLMNGFVVPGAFGTAMEFFNRYSYPGRFGGFEGARNLSELRDRSKPHYVRHLKSQVATHLPPLRVQNLVLDPDERLAAAIKRAHRDAQEEIRQTAATRKGGADDEELHGEAAMTAVGMLRLMCSSPRLLYSSSAPSALALVQAGLVPEVDGPKLDELRQRAAGMQEAGERLVVFTSFRSMADLIAQRLSEDGIRHVTFTGQTSSKDREEAVAAFTGPGSDARPAPTVFVATDAAAEGLNLQAECSTLINFDLPFKPSTLIQRGNRIHRIDGDTERRYLVINYTLARTIEEGIIRLVGTKADLADAILGERGMRRTATGRQGRSVFEDVLRDWSD